MAFHSLDGSLDVYVRVLIQMADPYVDRLEVLAEAGLGPAEWQRVHTQWLARLDEDAHRGGPLAQRFGRACARAGAEPRVTARRMDTVLDDEDTLPSAPATVPSRALR